MTEPLPLEIDFGLDPVPNLHELIDSLRPHGPVVRVKYLGEPVWLINTYEELRQAFSDEEHFASAAAYKIHSEPSMGKTMQTMGGEEHRINRALVSRSFFPREVRSQIEPLIVPEAHALLDRIEELAEVDMVEAFSRPYPFTIITRMLGIPVLDDEKFLHWAIKIIDYPWDPEGALKAKAEFDEYMVPLINQRRSSPGDDVISVMATAEIEGETLTDEEILSFCRLLFPAGSDTTYKNLGSLLYAVLADPEIREQVLESEEARAAIVQEGLRWEPPTALLPRMCSKDTALGGVELKAGEWVLFGITAANNDPAEFPDPRRFDPARKNKNLAFGHGEHFCLGSHLARRELEVALQVVVERFPDMCLVPEKPVEIVQGVLRGPRVLWVRPQG